MAGSPSDYELLMQKFNQFQGIHHRLSLFEQQLASTPAENIEELERELRDAERELARLESLERERYLKARTEAERDSLLAGDLNAFLKQEGIHMASSVCEESEMSYTY